LKATKPVFNQAATSLARQAGGQAAGTNASFDDGRWQAEVHMLAATATTAM
jgi:hypothetical protein